MFNEFIVFFNIRYGIYHVDFTLDYKNRTLTNFGKEFMKVVNENGFPTQHLTTLLPLEAVPIEIPVTPSFTPLPPSAYPSDASVTIFNVRVSDAFLEFI